MKMLAIVTSFLALGGCANSPCDLCGEWRSNADLTLDEMARSDKLSDKQRRFFSDNFFGRLTVETRESSSRAYFPDDDLSSISWEPSEVILKRGNSLLVKERLGGKTIVRSVLLRGDCYRVDQPDLGFGEWFCRVKGQPSNNSLKPKPFRGAV